MNASRGIGARVLSRIPTTISVAAVTICALGLAVAIVPALREGATALVSNRPSALRTGDRLAVDMDVFKGGELTAVLFGRSTCSACAKAAPYIRELTQRLEESGVRTYFMSTAGLSPEELKYGASIGISRPLILAAPAAARLRIPTVPAVVVLDRAGRVRLAHYAGFRSPGQAIYLATQIIGMLVGG
jgi:hypothetical protein